ncbi:MAG: guanylate kinase [Flavobacteriales bacterium]|jgi:guanylate kinase|nr:guanylate kinase [Flavobacteriales bacterium]
MELREDGTGKCIILSAPSGAGKTTIVRHLLGSGLGLAFSVSATTRPPRANERDGHDYHFRSEAQFKAHVLAGDLVEWEEVYPGRFYGTLRSEVDRIWAEGHHAIFDIDVIGGLRLKEIYKERALAIFVAPPSMEALEERLRSRGTETESTLRTRLDKARQEWSHAPSFDHVLVNDDLQRACEEAVQLVNRFLA